jgi:uncharacterized protein with HEPN domain
MQKNDRDLVYVQDILDAAQEATGYCAGFELEDYVRDRRTSRAVERCLEIIGEAARRISPEFQASHPLIPWQKIISQRNVLAHDYGQVRQERVFLVIRRHLPVLIEAITAILTKEID